MAADEVQKDSVIPDKAFFRIGEVSEIVGVKPYVVRYWETEFKQLRPNKTRTNQRVYSKADVRLLLTIKSLLYDDHFTIAGARQQLEKGSKRAAARKDQGDAELPFSEQMREDAALAGPQVKSFLKDLEDTRGELEKAKRKVDQAENRGAELDTKLAEERRMRSRMISYLKNHCNEVINLLDSHVDRELVIPER